MGQSFLDAHHRHIGKFLRHGGEHRFLLRGRRTHSGKECVRRSIDDAGRGHENEIHPAGTEIDVAQIEDAQIDVPPDDVDRDRVADFQPHATSEIARE